MTNGERQIVTCPQTGRAAPIYQDGDGLSSCLGSCDSRIGFDSVSTTTGADGKLEVDACHSTRPVVQR